MAGATRKRKRASTKPTTSPSPTTTLSTFATQLKADPTKLSLLLDLPPELRNAIYEQLIATTSIHLSRVPSRKTPASTSALPRANKQLRDEFLSAALLTADIQTTSSEFSFRHIVTFLKRLSEVDLRALPSIDLTSRRKIVVEILPDMGSARERDFLHRWIRRAGHPTKKGTDIDFEYHLSDACRGGDAFLMQRMRRWERLARLMPEGRRREEFEKIIDALRK